MQIKKGLYVIIGTIALGIGIIGIYVPLVPTTPLVLLAAACYMRGSERLHNWILRTPWFGDVIKNYESGKGLRKSTKIKAISLMWVSILGSVFFVVDIIHAQIALIVISVAVTGYLLRLPTVPEV